jgi:putative transposase
MAGKRDKPEEIVSKLRQVEVLQGQGMSVAQSVRQIGVTEQTYYRWRKQYGGMSRGQLRRLKEMDYILKRWAAFTRFLDDGRICITNNAAERALRGIALGRKSWLFAGSDR